MSYTSVRWCKPKELEPPPSAEQKDCVVIGPTDSMIAIPISVGSNSGGTSLKHRTLLISFLRKGTFAGFQAAAFYEEGTASPNMGSNFWKNFRNSYGLGARFLINSVIFRIDQGFSQEGSETTVYIGYGFWKRHVNIHNNYCFHFIFFKQMINYL